MKKSEERKWKKKGKGKSNIGIEIIGMKGKWMKKKWGEEKKKKGKEKSNIGNESRGMKGK